MKIVIIGAGFSGSQLAKTLIAEGNKVVLVDRSAERVRSAGDQLDCTVIEADGSNLEVLEKAGISSADALVTITGDDDTNLIICSLVDAVYPETLKIARVRDYEHYMRVLEVTRRRRDNPDAASHPMFGVDYIVNPDVEAAGRIMRAMEIGATGASIDLNDEYNIVVLPVAEGSRMAGKSLKDLAALEDWNFLAAFIESDGEASLPGGESVFKAGDHVGILARKEDTAKLLEFTGADSAPMERVAIFGADNVGALTVAAQAESSQSFWYRLLSLGRSKRKRLIVIDRDVQRCRDLAEKFPEARILNGDITDDGLIQSEGVCDCDLVVAASGNYERNLMTAAYLKLRGVGKAIALTSDSAFDEIAGKLGIDVTVPMRDVVIDTIVSHLRGRNVKSVHSVGARKYEIVSCEVSQESRFAGKSLREIGRIENSLVLLVRQPGSEISEIPNGATVLNGGAQAVIIVPAGETGVLGMFAGKPEIQA
ncbi:MAG: NAD-binding protein [Kiritimatiellae bacterium]|nr:NAD-binding protein [Kiritimatiellia bacterium]